MHAYCTVLKLNTGHLIYAGSRSGTEDTDAVIRNGIVTIRIHPLDVTVSPSGLLDQVREIASQSLAGVVA